MAKISTYDWYVSYDSSLINVLFLGRARSADKDLSFFLMYEQGTVISTAPHFWRSFGFFLPSYLGDRIHTRTGTNKNTHTKHDIIDSFFAAPPYHHQQQKETYTMARDLDSDSNDYEYYSTGTVPENNDDDVYKVQPFADGIGEYDEYQQAWRFLGFMVDCNAKTSDDDDGSGSGDSGTGDGCKRYLLWAAVSILSFFHI
jgi:hypothetical protein